MNEAAAFQLRRIITNYGLSICDNPRQVEALLRDLSGEHRREVFVLAAAAREGIPSALLASTGDVPATVLTERLARTLQDNLGLGADAARWAITSWASALSVPGFAAQASDGAPATDHVPPTAKGTGMSWEDLRGTYMSMLADEGFRPEVDKYGDIHFKREGGNYFVTSNCDDTYFYMLYPSFWRIEDEAARAKALSAANAATSRIKAAKVYVDPDGSDVSATLEVLISSPSEVRKFLSRGFRCIQSAVSNFIEEMNKD